ncbi:MAG: methionyl-tRNA formyltransferase [Patescibacteria group bacterium]
MFIFFGASQFAIPILEALKTGNMPPKLIVTGPDKPAGRGLKLTAGPVKLWAEKNNIPFIQPENLKDGAILQKIKNIRSPLFITAAYGKIIPKEILEIPESGSLNVHPSLLPRWRGADPIRTAMLAGDKKSGVSIILMDEKIDHGPILESRTWNLESRKTYTDLEKELAELGGKLLVEVILKWLAGEIKPREQDHLQATYTKKITKEDGHIDWNEPAETIERKIRALNPWPGTYAFWNKKRIKIIEGVAEPSSDHGVGEVFVLNSKFSVSCKNGAILIKKVQIEGKKPQDTKDFLSGYPDIIGSVLK